ncbi:hypothetical protein B0I35DRAFT_428009 [Stachybotrys elegans]|uniref:RING-type domain-containing protein n=1 Tax=Stachybotrys elegans TaxID=80388 RepID=A0A8K0STY5_9HYPO|nr:hypothetical protein B0I35DRAFT_428009 [Stachybotrys elegans]
MWRSQGEGLPQVSPESSDDSHRLSPAVARRLARRNRRRTSPTPDLVTSLVRPPSPLPAPDALYVPLYQSQVRRDLYNHDDSPGSIVGAGRMATGIGRKRTGPLRPPHPSSLDVPAEFGGSCVFDFYSLMYVDEANVDPSLLCPICHDPLVDPITTPCDHTFCYRCIRRSFESSPTATCTCPIDREPLIWPECFSAPRLIRTQLNNLVVKCPNHARGCTKELKREIMETHATSECRYKDYLCPDPNCDKRLRTKPADDVCRHRETACTLCDAKIEEAQQDLHLLSCPKSKARCESCWQMICRNQMDAHHGFDCEGVEVGCPYQELGCSVQVLRGQLTAHELRCGFHPDTPTGIVIRAQRELIQSFSDQLQEVREQQEESKRRIDELSAMTSRRGDKVLSDNHTMQDLDAGFEEIHQNLTQLEARQSMWTLNQVMPIREEVTEIRNNINMVRMQVTWLLNRSREEGRIRAANSGSTAIRRDSSGEGGPVLMESRRSSGAEADQPRL